MRHHLAIVGNDGRTERTEEVVQHSKSWDQIHERLQLLPDTTQHLL